MFQIPTSIPNIKRKENEFIKLKKNLENILNSVCMRQKFVKLHPDNETIINLCLIKQSEFESIYYECIIYSKQYINFIDTDIANDFYYFLLISYDYYNKNKIPHRISL